MLQHAGHISDKCRPLCVNNGIKKLREREGEEESDRERWEGEREGRERG